jgi:hypothetical protein
MSKNHRRDAVLVRDTFREAFARKIFWGFFGCSTALILFFIFILRIDVVQGAIATVSLFGNASRSLDVQRLVRQAHGAIAAFLFTAGLFLAVFASAGLIPSVFERGRMELLLSKPVERYHVLLGRYAQRAGDRRQHFLSGVRRWLIFRHQDRCLDRRLPVVERADRLHVRGAADGGGAGGRALGKRGGDHHGDVCHHDCEPDPGAAADARKTADIGDVA